MHYERTSKPLLYEINTRVWLSGLSRNRGRRLTLAEVPEEEIQRIAGWGVDLVWLMGVWTVGKRGVEIASSHPDLDREYRQALPDFNSGDVWGSPYAICEYTVDERLGGPGALKSFREKLARRGLGLILDFVPNHTGLDHRWIWKRPEYYVQGDEEDLGREPENYLGLETAAGRRILAHGRDPHFPGWTDTAQLNYCNRRTRLAMIEVLKSIGEQCDGVRCDMAMLVLDEIFRKVWGERCISGDPPAEGEFWTQAIAPIRERNPGFLFLAETYWDLEARLQELGFDYTYDKVLYDRLLHQGAPGLRAHLGASISYQLRSARFLENHDEPRAHAVLSWEKHRAAALIAGTVPGMALFHEGQFEGRKVRVPVQLGRGPDEAAIEEIRAFYKTLIRELRDPVLRFGQWRLLDVHPAWPGNPSFENFLAHEWKDSSGSCRLVVVNYGPTQGQCYIDYGRPEWEGKAVKLFDLLGQVRFLRSGSELLEKGLYLDLPGFGYHLFGVQV